MSIKIEIRGPSPRCLYPRKESFVYFSESLRDSTITLRVETLFRVISLAGARRLIAQNQHMTLYLFSMDTVPVYFD